MTRILTFAQSQWKRAGTLAQKHDLDPRVFLALSLCGVTIHALYYLPCFKGGLVDLAFLVALRFLGLAGPLYVLLRGKRIAGALNTSLVLGWSAGTAWHVCYFVYL